MKKGFTLIELLGVMVILGIIALIITPSVTGIIRDSEEKTYNKQVDMIENAAKEWGIENIDFLPDAESGKTKIIDLNKLVSSGKIQNSTILDPRTKEEMSGCVTVNYNSEYNQYEYKYNEDGNYCANLSKICTPVTEATTGNVPQGEFAYGDEYICNLGDGERTFFVLEDGDNTTLSKGDGSLHYNDANPGIGTAGVGEVALIMSENYDRTTQAWCIEGNSNTCNADGLNAKLNEIDEAWTELERSQISLPTYHQIYRINNSLSLDSTAWLQNFAILSSGNYIGYWTSTASTAYPSYAFFVAIRNGIYHDSVNHNDNDGIRPVITISKNQIG